MNQGMRWAWLAIGAFIQGTAMAIFLFPHFVSSGGAAGLSIILNYLVHVPYAATLWILNAGMILLAFKWLGRSNAIGTMYCVSITSLVINGITPYITEPVGPIALDLLAGAILFGCGLGILFRLGASSGGMDILALLISKMRNTPPGKTLFYINTFILLMTGLIVDWRTIFYAIICQWISTRVIDFIGRLSPDRIPFGKHVSPTK
ncbi:MAG TPA: YitT family protein [Chondromyces sp.]|nr:YitT family protein [Chondromyces sp.]